MSMIPRDVLLTIVITAVLIAGAIIARLYSYRRCSCPANALMQRDGKRWRCLRCTYSESIKGKVDE